LGEFKEKRQREAKTAGSWHKVQETDKYGDYQQSYFLSL